MRRLLFLPLCVMITGTASGQGFAPTQSRAAEPPPRPARLGELDTRIGGLMGLDTGLLNSGMPVPAPLGAMADAGQVPGVLSARVPTAGAPVTVPPSAVASGVRLYTYTNAQGGLESVAYDPATGATVVYDQTVSFSLQDRTGQMGPGATPRIGPSAAAGIVNNPSFSLQPGRANPDIGIPLLNQAFPSYNSQSNLGLGQSFTPQPASSPFVGGPMNSLRAGSGPMTSPFAGTPLGTLGTAPNPMASPFSGTPMGTLGGGSIGGGSFGGGSFGSGSPSFTGSLGGGSP